MTTKRDRNHELEDLSVACLRLHLPPKWVSHEFRKDYGIDLQLELFNDNGDATGLRCYVQLKATDHATDRDVLSLDRDHFEYWGAHTDPVLLVRFYADNKKLAWCWLHDISWQLKPTANSLSVVKFLRAWDDEKTPREILGLLSKRNACYSSRLLPPFSISVSSDILPADEVANLVEKTSTLVNHKAFQLIVGNDVSCSFSIILSKTSVAISHMGLPGFVVSLDDLSLGEDGPSLVWLLIFIVACRYDRILAARPLAKRYFKVLSQCAFEGLQFHLVDSLVYAIGVEETIELLRSPLGAIDNISAAGLREIVAYAAANRYGQIAEWIDCQGVPLGDGATFFSQYQLDSVPILYYSASPGRLTFTLDILVGAATRIIKACSDAGLFHIHPFVRDHPHSSSGYANRPIVPPTLCFCSAPQIVNVLSPCL